MKHVWNEENIRAELKKLDKKTGLHGADIDIKFIEAYFTLGYFSAKKDEKMLFGFSNKFFQNDDFPYEMALDVIRHEYAHYMDYELYGGYGHSYTWKKCCSEVGANPFRLYDERLSSYYREKRKVQKKLDTIFEQYTEGEVIQHPVFGKGVISGVTGDGSSKILTVNFEKAGVKKLGVKWVNDNCGRSL